MLSNVMLPQRLAWGEGLWHESYSHCLSVRTCFVRGIPKVSKASLLEVSCFILETLTLSGGGVLHTQGCTKISSLAWLLKAHSSHKHFSTAKEVAKLTRNKADFTQQNQHVLILLGS